MTHCNVHFFFSDQGTADHSPEQEPMVAEGAVTDYYVPEEKNEKRKWTKTKPPELSIVLEPGTLLTDVLLLTHLCRVTANKEKCVCCNLSIKQ